MLLGVRDMGFNTVTNLFLTLGMPSFPLPPDPKIGCVMFDDYRKMWIVFNGKEWVDINLKEHKCSLNEKRIQD